MPAFVKSNDSLTSLVSGYSHGDLPATLMIPNLVRELWPLTLVLCAMYVLRFRTSMST